MLKYIINLIILFVLCSFCQVLQSDYEKDLKLILNTNKFGTYNEDEIAIVLKNTGQQDHQILFHGIIAPTYLNFEAFMLSKSGTWVKLNPKYQKIIGSNALWETHPVRIKAGKSLNLFSTIIQPRKWFEISQPGKLKLVAHYNYKQQTSQTTKDTLAIKIPSFKLNSDTVFLEVK